MNHISPGLKARQAMEGFLQAKAAEARSPTTITGYQSTLTHRFLYRTLSG